MSDASLVFWVWHAVASVVGAALLAWLAPLLHRTMHVSHASRRYWLGAWMLAVLPAPIAIVMQWFAPPSLTSALTILAPLGELPAVLAPSTPESANVAPSLSFGTLLMLLYAAGVGFGALRWLIALGALRRLLQTTLVLDPTALPGAHSRDECAQLRARGVRVVTVDSMISPFVLRWPRPTIVLPHALLARLGDQQLRLVLRHEAAHLAHHDPHWLMLQRVVGLLLWFNPWLRSLTRRVQLASELACDAVALGAEKNMRRAYAEAYLETLRMSMTRALPCPAIAFSPQDQGDHKMRIGHIVHGDPHVRKRPLRSLALATLALAIGSGFVALHASAAAAPEVTFDGPIIAGRISSPYGQVRASLSDEPHHGIDLAAARGTPVKAPAAGTVLIATETYDPPSYGTVIVLDHGDGWQTVYAHLDGLDVKVGEQVVTGQQIGRLGSTGKATGPHVHVEVHRHGQHVDPASAIRTLVAAP